MEPIVFLLCTSNHQTYFIDTKRISSNKEKNSDFISVFLSQSPPPPFRTWTGLMHPVASRGIRPRQRWSWLGRTGRIQSGKMTELSCQRYWNLFRPLSFFQVRKYQHCSTWRFLSLVYVCRFHLWQDTTYSVLNGSFKCVESTVLCIYVGYKYNMHHAF